jgi:NADH dehydrogenase [ubiquinone] 1 alpha subcomplex assembly factor 7
VTPLGRLVLARIAAEGPMTVADYMAICLMHPLHGYYATRDPFGAAGDFTTAPEISQVFGELLGLALAQAWLDQGEPAPFTLAELGPGRGTLMADVLRATARVPGFRDALRLHLVETSPVLRARQAQALPVVPEFHDSAATLPEAPLFLLANEFFDALPIRQFVRDGGGWRERMVGAQEGRLVFGLGTSVPLAALAHRLGDTAPTEMVETCAPAAAVIAEVGRRIAMHGGAAVVFDYGGWRSRGDTLQALAAHRFADPLAAPGEADLTAHVDFEALAQAAGCAVSPLLTQGAVLERLGIDARAEVLARGLSGARLDAHRAAVRRLTHPAEMGTLFRTIALAPSAAALPPGYHDA